MVYSPGGFTRALESSTWTSCKLGDICKVKTGKLPAKAEIENGEYPFFTANTSKSCRTNTYSYDNEAILMAKDGEYAGFVRYYNGKFDVSNHSFVIYDFSNNINAKYFYYHLQLINKELRLIASGGAIPGISMNALSQVDIKFPDLETQKMIAELLSNYDALIENISSRANSQTTNLINQKQAIMDTIFRGLIGGMKSPGAQ